MEDKQKKHLRAFIVGKGTDAIIKYETGLGAVYFVPEEIQGEEIRGYMVSPRIGKPTHSTTLSSLLRQNNLSMADFKKMK